MIGIHLPISVHLRDDLRAESGGTLVPGHHRGSNALVPFELHQIDSGIADISDHLARRIGTPVVDNDDVPDERGHARDDARDGRRCPVRGNDHRDDGQLDRNDRSVRGRCDEEEVWTAHVVERRHRVGDGLAWRIGLAEGLGATRVGSSFCAVASSVCASAVWPICRRRRPRLKCAAA